MQHINRKNSCVEEEKNANKTCTYCNKFFPRKDRLIKHMDTCKKKPIEKVSEKPSEISELKQIIIDMKEQITKLENKPTVINNNCNNNNSINIQQNIILPYGKEDLEHLTDKDYKQIFTKGCYSVPELIKVIHCNTNKPQNMNIFIKNLANEYLFVHNGKDWDVMEKDEVIHNMIENKKHLLECKYEDDSDNLSKYDKYMFKKYLDKSEIDELKNNVKKEIKMILYNNRNNVKKPLKTTKLTKSNKTTKKPKTMKMIIEDD